MTTRLRGTYYRPSLLRGWRKAKALERVAKLGTAVATFVFAALNAVDMASDIAVAVELVQGGNPGWGITSAIIIALSVIVSVAMLLFERRLVVWIVSHPYY